jgi:membrane-associated protein
MESFVHLITSFGVLAILLVVFAESGLLIGFVLPGDSLLFTAGYMVQQNSQHIDIHIFALLVFAAAVLGDSVGYSFGHKVGRKLFEKENSRFFKKKYLEQTEKFYDKHGSATIVLARFVPIVRTFAPIVAGASKMHYKKIEGGFMKGFSGNIEKLIILLVNLRTNFPANRQAHQHQLTILRSI